MKVAIVHYWLVNMRGGEKVVEALCEIFPDADIYTHVYDPGAISEIIKSHRIRTTFIDKLPQAAKRYQAYLPLMPLALEQLDLRNYDLIISSESGPAKGVILSPDNLHVCYCHTPMRYVWEMYFDYRRRSGTIVKMLMPFLIHYLRLWDIASAARVDHFIANSSYVAKRIKKHYRREAEVIHPPVDTSSFYQSEDDGDFYLMVGQLVPYKRTDLAVEAFNRLGKKLIVIGDGEELPSLKKIAHSNIQFLGYQPFSTICDHYARCKALIFPGLEDFGIVPVEAMAAGRPVIAFGKGGALDTVIDGVTGLFFYEQSTNALINAIGAYENAQHRFSKSIIINHARCFEKEVFKKNILSSIDKLMNQQVGREGIA